MNRVCCGVCSLSTGLIIVNFFDGSPCANVRLCCICAVIVIGVAMIAVVTIVAVVIAVVTTVLATVIIVIVIVGVGVGVIVVPGWALTFLVATFGPALGLHVSKVMAIIAFDVAHVAPLLGVCDKSFIIAIVLLADMIFVVILYESNDSVSSD